MFFDPPHKKDAEQHHKEPSLDLVGLIFIGVLIAIPMFLYLIAQ